MTIIDTLPDELLLHILALVHPPTPFPLRLSFSLSRCCLVSRRWRDIAQPLLYRAIVLRERPGTQPLQAIPAAVLPLVQHARSVAADEGGCELDVALQLLRANKRIETVRLVHYNPAGEDFLLPLPHVKHLHLSFFNFYQVPIPSSFPLLHLTSLTLLGTTIWEGLALSLFNSSTLPSLRAFSISDLTIPDARGYPRPLLSVLRLSFLARLDILQLTFNYCAQGADLESVPLPSSADNVLTTVQLGYRGDESPINQVQHLCLTPFDPDGHTNSWDLADLSAFEAGLPAFRSLRTILLPLELKSPSPARASTALLGPFRTSILRHCKHEGVEVLWSDWPFEEGEEEQASWPREEFARWVRKRREEGGQAFREEYSGGDSDEGW
ncbi:hypothetical protein JCM6882_004458 [Rhodosporidiobolus microsporus]